MTSRAGQRASKEGSAPGGTRVAKHGVRRKSRRSYGGPNTDARPPTSDTPSHPSMRYRAT